MSGVGLVHGPDEWHGASPVGQIRPMDTPLPMADPVNAAPTLASLEPTLPAPVSMGTWRYTHSALAWSTGESAMCRTGGIPRTAEAGTRYGVGPGPCTLGQSWTCHVQSLDEFQIHGEYCGPDDGVP